MAARVRLELHAGYVRSDLVVEIAFNDIRASPHYPDGVALRFAPGQALPARQGVIRMPTRSTLSEALFARQSGAHAP